MTTDHTVIFKPETLLKLYWSGIKDSATNILSFQANRLRYNVLCLDTDKTLIYIRNAEFNFNGDDSNTLQCKLWWSIHQEKHVLYWKSLSSQESSNLRN